MKTFVLIATFVILFLSYAFCQDTTSSAIQVKFKVPKDWKMMNSTTYVLKDFDKTLNYWEKELSSGHQPWRLEPSNVAAACLWDFGVKDESSVVDDFASRLTIIEAGKVYSLKTDQQTFVVYIKTEKKTPIAYKLEIKK
jgi:hypothetical protein